MRKDFEQFVGEVIIRKDKSDPSYLYRTNPIRFVFADDKYLIYYFGALDDVDLIAIEDKKFKKHEFITLREALENSKPIFKKIKFTESEENSDGFRLVDQEMWLLCELSNGTVAVEFKGGQFFDSNIQLVEKSLFFDKNNKIETLGDIPKIEPYEIYKKMVRQNENLNFLLSNRQIMKEIALLNVPIFEVLNEGEFYEAQDVTYFDEKTSPDLLCFYRKLQKNESKNSVDKLGKIFKTFVKDDFHIS